MTPTYDFTEPPPYLSNKLTSTIFVAPIRSKAFRVMRLTVIGNGPPLRRLLEGLRRLPITLQAVITDAPTPALYAELLRVGAHGVYDTALLRSSSWPQFGGGDCDWLVSINSKLVVPPQMLARFPQRAINCHPGLLPEYAGLHVHQWAIRNGETTFGVTVHFMDATIDTGAILVQQRFPVRPQDTGLTLFTRCVAAEVALAVDILARITAGEALTAQAQDPARRHFYRHRDALDGRIDWRWPAAAVVNFIRAGNYLPLASPTYVAELDPLPDGRRIEVLAATANGPTSLVPGTLVSVAADGPVIAAGDNQGIRIVQARSSGHAMDAAAWQRYFDAFAGRLRGRGA
jgi:UDP-4-amino-4-deoxy-L-arabinose formyltransferase/UDP-glucuronic acid dehydrogenase (UDP-4-keto-hexauronic acid decarboxylating)